MKFSTTAIVSLMAVMVTAAPLANANANAVALPEAVAQPDAAALLKKREDLLSTLIGDVESILTENGTEITSDLDTLISNLVKNLLTVVTDVTVKLVRDTRMDFNLKIIADLDTVHDYLKGILWTIFFTRLFGSIKPDDNNSFLDIPYPTTPFPELESLIESKIVSILDGLTSSTYSQSNYNVHRTSGSDIQNYQDTTDNDNSSDELFYRCVMVIKFYERSIIISNPDLQSSTKLWGNSNNNEPRQVSRLDSDSSLTSLTQRTPNHIRKYINCWEKWILSINIINNRNQKMMQLSNTDKLDLYKDDFENNLFNVIDFVDANKDHIPPIQSIDKSPFPYKIVFALNTHDSNSLNQVFTKFEIPNGKINDSMNNMNNEERYSDDQQDSMEYITTTEAGDVIMSTSSNANNYNNDQNHRSLNSGEEMLRNGYKFIKKLLE
ncbi:hypothetical protein CANARDRAFT_7074 [[Candida] arabinofermentans NRRL YB-2248]|uniref:Autophagy-related protein 101 n=1 Tax=[Candida] arabinofermentans NRRL YB-2248 TaxID=983967 RepID=A0A1E4T1T4_9ASCO|nr:hypothetical protein CANARDRAFT_7074 [[Candida] arabinofermentans NRRL YB-2248]